MTSIKTVESSEANEQQGDDNPAPTSTESLDPESVDEPPNNQVQLTAPATSEQDTLPPFRSLLTNSPHQPTNLLNIGTTAASVSYYQDIYQTAANCWESTMTAAVSNYQNQCSQAYPVINSTDEFFFTAQQMAAQIFDHYNSNTYCLQQQQQQQQQHCSNAIDYNGLMMSHTYSCNQSTMYQEDFGNNNGHNMANWQPQMSTASNSSFTSKSPEVDGKGNNDQIYSASEGEKPMTNRQTVLMLPPPVNYRRRNERERERVSTLS